MIPRLLLLTALSFRLIAEITPEASEAAADKFDRIARADLESGETVTLSEDELNSFLRHDGAAGIPEGIEDVHIRLRDGGGVIEAVVNSEAAGQAREDAPFFIRLLMLSARNISADIDYEVRAGIADANVISVKIDDRTLNGAALTWFLASFAPEPLRPYLSGEPIPLKDGIDEVRVEPGQVVFTAK